MHRLPRSRRALAACAVPALLLALSACDGEGSSPASGDDRPGNARSATKDKAEKSDKADDKPGDGADDGPVAGQGKGHTKQTLLPAMMAAVEEHRSAHFTMEMTGAASMSAEGDLVYRETGPELQMTMSGAGLGTGTIEMRLVDQMLYMTMPGITPDGKFVEIDPDAPGSPFAQMGGLAQLDPLSTFDAFEAGLRKVEHVGEETVGGEALQHYVLTVDLKKAAKAQGQPLAPMTGMPRDLAYELWLDDEDLMRRVEFGLMQQVSMVMEMSRWGERVTVEPPPRRDIVQPPGG